MYFQENDNLIIRMEAYANNDTKKAFDIMKEKSKLESGSKICVTGVRFNFVKDEFKKIFGYR